MANFLATRRIDATKAEAFSILDQRPQAAVISKKDNATAAQTATSSVQVTTDTQAVPVSNGKLPMSVWSIECFPW